MSFCIGRVDCSFNLNNPELTIFITFKMTNIASENQEIVNSLIGNNNRKINVKFITFDKTKWARFINFETTWQCLHGNSKL